MVSLALGVDVRLCGIVAFFFLFFLGGGKSGILPFFIVYPFIPILV